MGVDRTAWKVDDKNWVKERKAYWKLVEKNLKHANRFDTLHLKYIKDYCLFGILPEDEDGHYYDENITLPLVVLLWLYPEYNYEKWLQITQLIIARNYNSVSDIEDSYSILINQEGSSLEYSQENKLGSGFFLGSEKYLIDFFCYDQAVISLLESSGMAFNEIYLNPKKIFINFFTHLLSWFEKKEGFNPYFTPQFLFELMVAGITDEPEVLPEKITEEEVDVSSRESIMKLSLYNKGRL